MSNDIQNLVDAWLKLTPDQKAELINTAPEVYFAASRLVRNER